MKKNVLIVDDDKIARIIHRGLLLSAGYNVFEAESGEEAVNQFLSGQPSFDIILMDYNMPGMDGAATTRAIRNLESSSASVLIIGTTADISPETKEACLTAGMDAVIHKPILPADLEQLLKLR